MPVHKKRSKSEPDNYEPISLLSVVSKTFESIIEKKLPSSMKITCCLLDNSASEKDSLPPTCCSCSLNSCTTLDACRPTLVTALDIAGTFDCVWHHGLLAKLQQLGVDGDLLHLFSSYLLDKSFRVTVGDCTSTNVPVEAFVPQGSILGPIQWNIYFNCRDK